MCSCTTRSRTATGSQHSGRAGVVPSRREAVFLASIALLPGRRAAGAAEDTDDTSQSASTSQALDTTITDQVFFDVGVCTQGVQANRTLGDNAFCSNPESLGRIVIGLYGKQAPKTVQNFLTLVQNGSYNSTLFSKVLPGEYILAGKQGSPRFGEVALASTLPPNDDLMRSASFGLSHQRAGTVSLNLSHNEDDPSVQQRRSYRNVGFLITTGPGPAPSLDGTNVVFGKVVKGMEVVGRVTSVPTFKPINSRMLALNRLGSMLGDERAGKTRRKWGKPLTPVLITRTGVVEGSITT